MATIYRKTAKGQHELDTRALKLAPRFRSVLILVDGRRTDEDLQRVMPQADTVALEALAAGGFIEAIAVTQEPRPALARPPAPPPAAAPASGDVWRQRRAVAVRTLTDLVGPLAEPFAMRMENAASEADFRAAVESAARVLADMRGRQAALDYVQRFTAQP